MQKRTRRAQGAFFGLLIAPAVWAVSPMAHAGQITWAPIVVYYNFQYPGSPRQHFSSPEAAAKLHAEDHRTYCPGTPGSEYDNIYDHVENVNAGAPYYDAFWDSYYKIVNCAKGTFVIAKFGEQAGRDIICDAGRGYHAFQEMPTPGVCTAPTIDETKNQGPCPFCAGNPINPANGNKFEVRTEYRGTGPFPLDFTWTYNSRQTGQMTIITGVNENTLGANRRHSYSQQVVTQANAYLTSAWVMRPDGKMLRFSLSGSNDWTGDSDINDRLTRTVDGAGGTTGWQYTRGADDALEQYDANGRLISIVNRGGLRQTMAYDTNGRLASVTDDFGRQLGFNYDVRGLLTGMTDPSGQPYVFTYDSNRNLTQVTYPDVQSRGYVYEVSGVPSYLTGIVDENLARYATFAYDTGSDRAISTEHAGGVSKYLVDYYGNVTDPLMTRRVQGYAAIVGVKKNTTIEQPCVGTGCSGPKTLQRGYDTNGNVNSFTDYRGNLTTYTYDLTRNLETSRTEAQGTAQARTIATTWHPSYRLPATITEPTAAGSKVTTLSYDANGNLTGKSIAVGGATRSWSWTYDSLGRVLTESTRVL